MEAQTGIVLLIAGIDCYQSGLDDVIPVQPQLGAGHPFHGECTQAAENEAFAVVVVLMTFRLPGPFKGLHRCGKDQQSENQLFHG